MIQNFDFHIHTKHSDGEYSVEEIIKKIREFGIKYFSITDHDSIESIKEVKKNDLTGLYYIPGVEISSILDNKYKMHILGYFIDDKDKDLNEILKKLEQARKDRFLELANGIKENYGFYIPYNELEEVISNVKIPGKPHLAKLMAEHNYISNIPDAYENYLDKIKTKTSSKLPADLVIKTIKKAGGIAIWAHPKKVENKYNINFESLIPHLKKLGLDGIEAFNSLHTYDDSIRFLEFCKQNNLIVSGGSDYHGPNIKQKVKLGVIYNSSLEKKVGLSNINIIKNNDCRDINYHNISKLNNMINFIKKQLDENILPYIYEKNLMVNDGNDIYKEYININSDLKKLEEKYKNKILTQNESIEIIKLYNRMIQLINIVSKTKNSDANNQYKLKN